MIIVRYSEIGLKGQNRAAFENILVENIRDCLKKNNVPFARIERIRGRILVHTDAFCDALRYVFGIHSFSYATRIGSSLEDMKAAVKPLLKHLDSSKTFRVSAKRIDKDFPITSLAIEQTIGEYVVQETQAIVSLKEFAYEICFEILNNAVYLFDSTVQAFGGLPVGSSGKVLLLVESPASILAGILMMKRGCRVVLCTLSEQNLGLIEKFCYGQSFLVHPITLDIVDTVAEKEKTLAVVSGQLLADYQTYTFTTPVLRPLIGFSENNLQSLQEVFA